MVPAVSDLCITDVSRILYRNKWINATIIGVSVIYSDFPNILLNKYERWELWEYLTTINLPNIESLLYIGIWQQRKKNKNMEVVLDANFANNCRLCLSSDANALPLFQGEDKCSYADQILYCFSVKVSIFHKFPHTMFHFLMYSAAGNNW
jgi:hypothetical protein